FTVYGPGENQGRLLPSLIECTKTSGKIPLTNGSQRRDFIYVEDVAQGLLRLGLTDGNKYKIVNLATGKLLSVKRFVETAASLLKINAARLDFGTIPVRQEEMKHDPVTIKRLQDITKWQPAITIKEGIMQTVKFLERLNRSTVKK
ncbi:MAG: NAD-dependent epimerase/dehydratase family protein, partial [Nitrosopumilaceae archaeon]|nr:NAD-dependent epimerase/dehydratase family protein [Nitrosopumilaceae archaeon]NIX63009.1 NAD-dependent epimerase/dehydratase family protein [Nitrosopumilaceae archaeon]